jgi:hypothetical protein
MCLIASAGANKPGAKIADWANKPEANKPEDGSIHYDARENSKWSWFRNEDASGQGRRLDEQLQRSSHLHSSSPKSLPEGQLSEGMHGFPLAGDHFLVALFPA